MLTVAGPSNSRGDFCDGVSRRDLLTIGTLGALGTAGGWSLPDLLRAESVSGRKSPKSFIMFYTAKTPLKAVRALVAISVQGWSMLIETPPIATYALTMTLALIIWSFSELIHALTMMAT